MAKADLAKLNAIRNPVLCLCTGAFHISPNKYFGRSRNYYATRKRGQSDIKILSESQEKPKSCKPLQNKLKLGKAVLSKQTHRETQ